MSLAPCAAALESDLSLNAIARAIRNDCSADPISQTPSCQKQISVNIFFDGTNNNLERDKKKVPNANKRSHTNVVVLFDACKDDQENGYYKFYIPGVGTAFPEIGEPGESDAGKAYGWGGESRIYWAMIQVLNAMLASVTGNRELLVSDAKAGKDVKSSPLHLSAGTDANLEGQQKYFGPLLQQLKTKLANLARPTLTEVKLNVFGFSRGAAQARAFCNFMDKLCDKDGTLAGVKLTFQFVGLFDTVASVGLADAAPGFNGFGGYANGTMDIPDRVQRCTHYVAGHEKRKAFPLSSVRSARMNGYPAKCHEVVYPGAHSDVGGGYAPGTQGKSMQGRSDLLSQVPDPAYYMRRIRVKFPWRFKLTGNVSRVTDVLSYEANAEITAYGTWEMGLYQTVNTMHAVPEGATFWFHDLAGKRHYLWLQFWKRERAVSEADMTEVFAAFEQVLGKRTLEDNLFAPNDEDMATVEVHVGDDFQTITASLVKAAVRVPLPVGRTRHFALEPYAYWDGNPTPAPDVVKLLQ